MGDEIKTVKTNTQSAQEGEKKFCTFTDYAIERFKPSTFDWQTKDGKQRDRQYFKLGGAGNWQHIENLLVSSGVSAACTQNIFHFTEESIQSLKQFLKNKDIKIRN